MSRVNYLSAPYEDADRDYYPPPRRRVRDYEDDEVDIQRASARPPPDYLREDYGRGGGAGELVVKDRRARRGHDNIEEDEVIIKHRHPLDREERSRGPREEIDVDVRREPRDRPRRREPEREDVDIDVRREGYDRPRPRRRDRESEEVDIDIREIRGPRRRDQGEEVEYARTQSERPRRREAEREEVAIDAPRTRRKDRDIDEIDVDIRRQRAERTEPRRKPREVEKDDIDINCGGGERLRPKELVIRDRSENRGPPQLYARERENFVYRRREPSPPQRREIEEIVIRRHSPSPVPAPFPPPEPEPEPIITRPPIIQEIITHHRHIDHGVTRAPSSSSSSPSPPPARRRPRELEIDIKRKDARGNTFEEDIKIIEPTRAERPERREREKEVARIAPPPPRRYREETNINIDLDLTPDGRVIAATLPPPPKPRPREKWTEVTKDLVSKDAIVKLGYIFEETNDFFYVMEYLRYEDIAQLVEVTEDLSRSRKERIEEIQWERQDPRLAAPPVEKVFEREIVYEERGLRRYR